MSSSLTMDLFLDPRTIKANALEDLQNRFLNGEPIVDANNVTTWFLENSSTTIADAMTSIKNEIEILYKLRANTIEDLYRHMSDYDITGIYSTPASLNLVIEIEKTSIVYDAKEINDNYRQVIIPKDTVFTLGDYKFGIYYPIVIKINKKTLSVDINWDTTEENSLYKLNNSAIDFVEVKEDGIDYIQMIIPTYQFSKTSVEETITRDMGLIKTYSYVDNFYAIKAYNYVNDKWENLNITLSETNYDIFSPTVRLIVDQDTKNIKVIVPSIYIQTNQISSKIKIDIYTTKGELDVDISSIETDTIEKNFNITTSDSYSLILNKNAMIVIYPQSEMIVGGSNGITTQELKKRIISNSFSGDVIKSTTDIENHFSNLGFTASRYACNVTDMIYLCHNQLTNSKGGVIAAGNITTMFTESIIENCNTIKANTDGSLTILPSTIYKYDSNSNKCFPLTTTEMENLSILNKEYKILQYNSNIYTKSPFHIRLDRSTRYPMAYTYDLNQPSAKYLRTINENFNVDVILKIYSCVILHDGITGYNIKFLVGKSDGFTPEDITLFFYTYSVNGSKVWVIGEYVTEYDGRWVYNVHIDTNYSIFKDNTIFLNNLQNDDGDTGYEVSLEFDANVVLLIKNNFLSSDSFNTNVGIMVPLSLKTDSTPVIEQRVHITLGKYLSGLYNNVDVIYKENVYLEYEEDVPARADQRIIETSIVEGVPTYTVIYNVGDILLDGEGNPIIKHKAGTLVLDTNGQPIVTNEYERNLDYAVDMIHLDAKLDIVTDPSYTNIMDYTRKKIVSYMDVIDETTNHLIEGTKLFYTPIKTLGYTSSSVGNGYSLNHSLELTVKFKLYVYDFVLKDENIKNTIYDNVVSIIDEYTKDSDNNVVASDVIVNLIKNNMSEYIINVNVYGFFDDMSVQTLICSSSNVKPHLKQYLVLEDDGTITVARGLTIEYVSI